MESVLRFLFGPLYDSILAATEKAIFCFFGRLCQIKAEEILIEISDNWGFFCFSVLFAKQVR